MLKKWFKKLLSIDDIEGEISINQSQSSGKNSVNIQSNNDVCINQSNVSIGRSNVIGNVTVNGKQISSNQNGIVINGTVVTGKNIRIYVDEKELEIGEPIQSIEVHIHGNCGKVNTMGSVTVDGDVNGDVKTQGRVEVGQNCKRINTQGRVDVEGDVDGSIKTMGRVDVKGSVSGSIDTMGKVTVGKRS